MQYISAEKNNFTQNIAWYRSIWSLFYSNMRCQADDISVKALSESLSFSPPCVAKTDGNRAHASSEGPSTKSKFLLAKVCFHRLSPPPPQSFFTNHTLALNFIPSSTTNLLLVINSTFILILLLLSIIWSQGLWFGYGICWVITRHPSNHPLPPPPL